MQIKTLLQNAPIEMQVNCKHALVQDKEEEVNNQDSQKDDMMPQMLWTPHTKNFENYCETRVYDQ